MRKLVLIRHSQPEFVTGVPASTWRLSAEGRWRCTTLAQQLAYQKPTRVITSLEPKAVETGQIVADILSLPLESVPGLHEHERPEAVSSLARESFRTRVAALFDHPSELVFGNETADEAHGRFSAALAELTACYQNSNLAVVTHGTVMTLYVSRAVGLDPVSFWRRLGLPSFAVLSLPDHHLEAVVERLHENG
jgi:broad specificity phosphatase PhoE